MAFFSNVTRGGGGGGGGETQNQKYFANTSFYQCLLFKRIFIGPGV